jgi:pyrimidine operon attenuation protein/uracil phosphoribosyltransferase
MRNKDGLVEERQLLDGAGIDAALTRVAEDIRKRHPDGKQVLLAGIRTGGVHLGERLRAMLEKAWGHKVPFATLDITLYRDDLFDGLPRPQVGPTNIPGTLEGKCVVLVDDVLYTGRTIRSALVELMDYGRAACIELAVLVDRGHRELPIRADYVGLTVETRREQTVRVTFDAQGVGERVILARRAQP